jgi:hypothetical protein
MQVPPLLPTVKPKRGLPRLASALVACAAVYLVLSVLHLWLGSGGDPFNTKLRQKSDQLRAGMAFQEVTNNLAEFEVIDVTDYPTPEQWDLGFYSERHCVTRGFTNHPTSTRIMFATPRRRSWGFLRDTCTIYFDARGIIIGYTWMYPT